MKRTYTITFDGPVGDIYEYEGGSTQEELLTDEHEFLVDLLHASFVRDTPGLTIDTMLTIEKEHA